MSAPQKEWLRYGELRDWLRDDYGISESQLLKFIGANVIRGRRHRHFKNDRDMYVKSEIVRDVLEAYEPHPQGNNGVTKIKRK